jgi:hypothetical protein
MQALSIPAIFFQPPPHLPKITHTQVASCEVKTLHIPETAIQRFVNMLAGAIHRADPSALVTVGVHSTPYMSDAQVCYVICAYPLVLSEPFAHVMHKLMHVYTHTHTHKHTNTNTNTHTDARVHIFMHAQRTLTLASQNAVHNMQALKGMIDRFEPNPRNVYSQGALKRAFESSPSSLKEYYDPKGYLDFYSPHAYPM